MGGEWSSPRAQAIVKVCVALAALAAVLRFGAADPLAACDRGGDAIDAVWNGAHRERVTVALRREVHSRDARAIGDRVVRGLDNYRARWIDLHHDACIDVQRGEQSAALLDRRMLCLRKRRGDLRATVEVLEQLDATSAGNAVDLVARMPQLADCADVERLQADTEPPPLAKRALVEDVRVKISQAMALDRGGASAAARDAAAAALELARSIDYPPIVADAALASGRVLLTHRDAAPALSAMDLARTVALEHGQLSIAIEAAARALFLEDGDGADQMALEREAQLLLPLSHRLHDDHFARLLLLNNLGTAYMAAENRGAATRYFQEASEGLRRVAEPDLELTVIDSNLAMVTADIARRQDLARLVWRRFRDELGEFHLQTLAALDKYARYTADSTAARQLLVQACDGYDAHHPELIEERVYCASYLAFLASELGDHQAERTLYERVAALAGPAPASEDVAARAQLAAGYLLLLQGSLDRAVAVLDAVAAADRGSRFWWIRMRAAHAEFGIGLAAQRRGRDAESGAHFAAALAAYRTTAALTEEVEFHRRAELAERSLAALGRRAALTTGGAGHRM